MAGLVIRQRLQVHLLVTSLFARPPSHLARPCPCLFKTACFQWGRRRESKQGLLNKQGRWTSGRRQRNCFFDARWTALSFRWPWSKAHLPAVAWRYVFRSHSRAMAACGSYSSIFASAAWTYCITDFHSAGCFCVVFITPQYVAAMRLVTVAYDYSSVALFIRDNASLGNNSNNVMTLLPYKFSDFDEY